MTVSVKTVRLPDPVEVALRLAIYTALAKSSTSDDLATERERQLTTPPADQTTGLTNRKAAN